MSLSLEEIIRKQADKIDQLEMRISELEAENKALKLENAELKEKMGLNSKNSSYDGILCMEGDRRLGGVFAN